MKLYLERLSILIGRIVYQDELLSLEQTYLLREENRRLDLQQAVKYNLLFSEKKSDRFKEFIGNLYLENNLPVYVWIPNASDCGVIMVSSINVIDFSFDFSVFGENVISIQSENLRDGILFDFDINDHGDEIMEVQIEGPYWEKVSY